MELVHNIVGIILVIVNGVLLRVLLHLTFFRYFPSARIRALEDTLKKMRALIDRCQERDRVRQPGDPADVWADYRARIDGFAQPVRDLRLEANEGEELGLGRFNLFPYEGREFRRQYGDLKRRIDDTLKSLKEHASRHQSASAGSFVFGW